MKLDGTCSDVFQSYCYQQLDAQLQEVVNLINMQLSTKAIDSL